MFSDAFKKAKALKIKAKSKKPKVEIRSSLINRVSNMMMLEDEEVESREVISRYVSSPHSICKKLSS